MAGLGSGTFYQRVAAKDFPLSAQEIHHVVPGSSRCLEAIASITSAAPAGDQALGIQTRFLINIYSPGFHRCRLRNAHTILSRLRAHRHTLRELWRPCRPIALRGQPFDSRHRWRPRWLRPDRNIQLHASSELLPTAILLWRPRDWQLFDSAPDPEPFPGAR